MTEGARNDRSRLSPGAFQDLPDASEIKRLGLVTVTADDRRCHRECVEDGFLRGLDRRGKKWIEVRVREDSHRVGAFLRVVGDDVAGGEGQDEIRSEERRVGKECRSRWSPYH